MIWMDVFMWRTSIVGVIRIDGRTGDFLQELLQDIEFCHDVCWTNTQPQVTLLYWSLNPYLHRSFAKSMVF